MPGMEKWENSSQQQTGLAIFQRSDLADVILLGQRRQLIRRSPQWSCFAEGRRSRRSRRR